MMFSRPSGGRGHVSQPPHRRYDIEGASLRDDNSKTRRTRGASEFVARLVVRANWAVVSWVLRAARARWCTSLLIVWALYREVVPSTRSYSRRVHGLDTKQDAQHAPAPVVGGSKGLTKPNEAPYPYLQDLILVCGHAVFVGTDHANAGDEKNWFLEEYQKADGQAVALLEHMRVGVELASKNRDALLLFSGGATRKNAGSVSEAVSYWQVSRAQKWWGHDEGEGMSGDGSGPGISARVSTRAFTETHARDSLENLLFSIARFRELTGKVPKTITVVGYEFKRARFETQHRAALRWPAGKFSYKGLPAASPAREKQSAADEVLVRKQFEKDPYACAETLLGKRKTRDPFVVGKGSYDTSNPDLAALFRWCDEKTFDGDLPW